MPGVGGREEGGRREGGREGKRCLLKLETARSTMNIAPASTSGYMYMHVRIYTCTCTHKNIQYHRPTYPHARYVNVQPNAHKSYVYTATNTTTVDKTATNGSPHVHYYTCTHTVGEAAGLLLVELLLHTYIHVHTPLFGSLVPKLLSFLGLGTRLAVWGITYTYVDYLEDMTIHSDGRSMWV